MNSLFLLMCLISLVIILLVLCIALLKRRAKGSLYFSYMLLSIFIFIMGSVIEAAQPDDFIYLQAARIQYLGAPFISPMMLLFFMDFCEIRIKPWRHILPLLLFPTCVALLTYAYPEVMLPAIEDHGSLFRYVYFTYSYIVMLLAFILPYSQRSKRDAIFKRQTTIIAFSVIIPMLGNALTAFTDTFEVDITVACISASGVIVGCALLFGGLLQVAPMAREEIVENMRDGFILFDVSGKFLDANNAAKKLFPQLKIASVGQPMNKVEGLPWDESGSFEQTFTMDTEMGAKHYRTSYDVVKHNGVDICHCISIYDITPVQELLNETTRLAEYDSLTGLMNRRAFFLNADEKCTEMEKTNREADKRNKDAFVLMIDLDNFKQINDTYGHQAGDEVLRTVSNKLASRFRKTDLLARYGGEELCAFLPSINASDAFIIAEECRKTIGNMKIKYDKHTLRMTISIGLAKYEAGINASFDKVIAQADEALYTAKENGRNRCIFFDDQMIIPGYRHS